MLFEVKQKKKNKNRIKLKKQMGSNESVQWWDILHKNLWKKTVDSSEAVWVGGGAYPQVWASVSLGNIWTARCILLTQPTLSPAFIPASHFCVRQKERLIHYVSRL